MCTFQLWSFLNTFRCSRSSSRGNITSFRVKFYSTLVKNPSRIISDSGRTSDGKPQQVPHHPNGAWERRGARGRRWDESGAHSIACTCNNYGKIRLVAPDRHYTSARSRCLQMPSHSILCLVDSRIRPFPLHWQYDCFWFIPYHVLSRTRTPETHVVYSYHAHYYDNPTIYMMVHNTPPSCHGRFSCCS